VYVPSVTGIMLPGVDGRNLFGCVGAGGAEKCWYPASAVLAAVSEAGDPRAVKAICYDQVVLVTTFVHALFLLRISLYLQTHDCTCLLLLDVLGVKFARK
jgi:hypothetical protein